MRLVNCSQCGGELGEFGERCSWCGSVFMWTDFDNQMILKKKWSDFNADNWIGSASRSYVSGTQMVTDHWLSGQWVHIE